MCRSHYFKLKVLQIFLYVYLWVFNLIVTKERIVIFKGIVKWNFCHLISLGTFQTVVMFMHFFFFFCIKSFLSFDKSIFHLYSLISVNFIPVKVALFYAMKVHGVCGSPWFPSTFMMKIFIIPLTISVKLTFFSVMNIYYSLKERFEDIFAGTH